MAQFTITKTRVKHQWLVRGEDFMGTPGETHVDGTQWAQVGRLLDFEKLTAEFDDVVHEHYRKITDKALEVKAALADDDEDDYLVIKPGVKGVEAQAEVKEKITNDSAVLQAFQEEGLTTERVTWVKGELIALPKASAPVPFVTVELDEV